MRSIKGRDGGTGVYMREGTTSRVTAADRNYSKFHDFYSASPENFGSTHVLFQKRSHVHGCGQVQEITQDPGQDGACGRSYPFRS